MSTSEHRPEQPTPKRFPLKTVLLTIFVGGPLAIVLVILGLWYANSLSLESKLAELRAAGQPTTAAEINDFYVVPDGVVDSTDLWVNAIDGITAAKLEVRGKALPIIGTAEDPIPPPGEAWTGLEASRMLLTELDPELQTVWKAAKAGGQARYPVDFSAGIAALLPYCQEAGQVARILSLDAHVAAHDGDHARALKDLRAIFALSDTMRGEPCLISQLVRIAIHAVGRSTLEELLPHSDWNDSQLQSLQESIASAQFKDEMILGMSGERATCLSAMDTASLGGVAAFRTTNKREALRLFEMSIDGLDGEWHEAIDRQREISADIKSMAGSKLNRLRMWGVMLLMPAQEQALIAGARAAAGQKTTIIAIALQRQRLKQGQLPNSLAEIDKSLCGPSPATLFVDPFNGKQLLLKTEESIITIYSVGDNQQDDGGKVETTSQGKLPDVGFTLGSNCPKRLSAR